MIEVRGPNVFSGYWRNPAKTAEELRPDGYFITGDLGQLDDRGYLRIVGREKDLIISGGYNIYPREIEELLDDLPGVEESAVIGMPHGDLGEVPFAVIVPARGAQVDVGPLLAELRGRLAKFKCPRDGAVIDSLPRNAMGKVQKKALREMFATRA
jgi:malonyl-CoA/methylmalonyl-CoA synthetase